jgi:hypothetical protein
MAPGVDALTLARPWILLLIATPVSLGALRGTTAEP